MVFETLFIFYLLLRVRVVVIVVVVMIMVKLDFHLRRWKWATAIDCGRDDMVASGGRVMVMDDMVVVEVVATVATI